MNLKDINDSLDDWDIGYFVEGDLSYSDNIKDKRKNFPFCPESKNSPQDNFDENMIEIKPTKYTENKNLICDWTDKKNFLIHYRMLKIYVTHGKIVNKVPEIISPTQSKRREKHISLNTQKRIAPISKFEKDFQKLRNNAFYGKTRGNVRNRLKNKFTQKDNDEEIIKQQSKLNFNGAHKPYTNNGSYTLKQNEVLMNKPTYLGVAVVELSFLLIYETYYDNIQPHFGEKNLRCH